jgi:4-amino-4-deoxy-L-arabinose transferase-like glycosyltransferase
MQWSIAMFQKVTGENVMYTRLSVYVISLCSLLAVFKLCFFFFKSGFIAALGVWVFSFFPVYFYHSVNPLPDNLALCFALWFLYFFFQHIKFEKTGYLILSCLMLMLAALCKLPYILFGIMPLLHAIITFRKNHFQLSKSLLKYSGLYVLFSLPVLLWYAWVIPDWAGNRITIGVFDQEVKIKELLFFLEKQLKNNIPTVVINYPTCLLVFVGAYFIRKQQKFKSVYFKYLFAGLLTFVLYFFFVLKQIREGHDYYLMPFLPFFLLIVLFSISHMLKMKRSMIIFVVLLLIAMPVFCWEKVKVYWDIELSYSNPDFFIYRDQLRNVVPNSAKCIMFNDNSLSIVPYTIDKQGYIFMNDELPVIWMEDMIKRGKAEYVYSDSRLIESQEGFEAFIQDTVLQVGSINVFKLKTY